MTNIDIILAKGAGPLKHLTPFPLKITKVIANVILLRNNSLVSSAEVCLYPLYLCIVNHLKQQRRNSRRDLKSIRNSKMVNFLVFGALSTILAVACTEVVPNSYIVQVGRDCGQSCRTILARSSGPDCTVSKLGNAGDGSASWVEVQCESSSNSVVGGAFSSNAADEGLPITNVEPNQVYTINKQLWGADEVDGIVSDGERCLSSNLGKDVVVSVMDTGCTPKGSGFDGIKCKNYVNDRKGEDYCGDGHGHGTHVAGTAASGFYGVAPLASVSCIRVLGDRGSGTTAGIIKAIMDVAAWSRANIAKKIVVNMSLGGGKSAGLNNAVTSAVKDTNIFFSLAAGNSNKDAKNFSPASASDGVRIVSVGAHDSKGKKASFSNYGAKVQISAPGVKIFSTVPGGFAAYSGTSMAAPHVAGAMAALWSSDMEPTLEAMTQGGSVAYKGDMKPKLNYLCMRPAGTAIHFDNEIIDNYSCQTQMCGSTNNDESLW